MNRLFARIMTVGIGVLIACGVPACSVSSTTNARPSYCHVYQDQISHEKYCKTMQGWWVLVKDGSAVSGTPNESETYWLQRPTSSLLHGGVPTSTLAAMEFAVELDVNSAPISGSWVSTEQANVTGEVIW